MPELPSVTIYIERLEAKVLGHPLEKIELVSPFVLRTVDPPLSAIEGQPVRGFRRIGKRIVFCFDDDIFAVVHLMISGRFRWREGDKKAPGRITICVFHFDNGRLVLTEASKKRRASLHLVRGEEALAEFDRGGIEVLDSTLEDFGAALTEKNHTLKRVLTDQRIFSGIGNAYSDEILHRAQLSPVKQSQKLGEDEIARLHTATIDVLEEWLVRMREKIGDGFPEKVTAFEDAMAVHGKYGEPCPVCEAPIQRIRYADNETNYCARCQNAGKLLADRSLSRLLKKDWPKRIEELEGK